AYSPSNAFPVSYTSMDASPSSRFKKVELFVKRPGASPTRRSSALTPGGASGGFSYTAAAGDGTYDFYTRAYDNAGNVEAAPGSADKSTFVDTNAPSSSATSPAFSTSNTFNVTYAAGDASPSSGFKKVELYVKGPADGSFSAVQTDTPGGVSGSFTYTAAEGDGNYSFYTRAYDKAGNVEAIPASADTTTFVDTVTPSSSATSPQYSTTNGFTVSYTSSDASPSSWFKKVELYVKRPGDSGFSLALTDTPGSTSGGFSYTAAAGDGSYSFYTRAYDNAGNIEAASISG